MNDTERRVAVLADDLIWASRLVAAVERAGATPLRSSSLPDLERLLATADEPEAVVVDLNGRAYDGIAAVHAATAAGRKVVAVGQHEDVPLRRRALEAGALRVYSYNKLFRDGPQVMAALLDGRL